MTQEFITRLFGAMMNIKKTHLVPEYWSPSSDGEITKEVRDFMAKELGEWWLRYCDDIMYSAYVTIELPEAINQILSISNLAEFIVKNYKEMFMEECPACQDGHVPVGEYQHYGLVSREMAMDAGNIDLMGSLTSCGTEIEWGQCQRCNGTGCICKYPEAEKIMKGEGDYGY